MMKFHSVLLLALKLAFTLTCLAAIAVKVWIESEVLRQGFATPLSKRVFIIDNTIVALILLLCLISATFSSAFFLQSSSCLLAVLWLNIHQQNPAAFWTSSYREIAWYSLLLAVIVLSQLLAFLLSSYNRRTEYIFYHNKPADENNGVNSKHKSSGNSYRFKNRTKNVNSDIIRNG